MKIQSKLAVLIVLIISFITVLMFVYKDYEEEKFHILFSNEQKDKEVTFGKLVDLKRQEILKFVDNYTYWDDIVDFVNVNQDMEWAGENIDTAIADFDVNSIWVFNMDESLIYHVGNLEDKALRNIILANGSIHDLFRQGSFCYFHIKTSIGIIEINGATINPTSDSQRKTPPQGYFLAGRLLDNNYIAELSRLIGGDVSIRISSDKSDTSTKKSQRDGVISFSKKLNDRNNNELAALNIIIKSDVTLGISQVLRNIIVLSIVFFILLALILIYFFIHWINNPIRSISRTLKMDDLSYSESLLKSKDEFGDMARLISNFFEQKKNLVKEISDREQAEERLMQSNHLLEKALAELTETQRKASQQERLKALGVLASGIAHDFNNALTPIMGYSDMLLTATQFLDDKKKALDYLKIINTSALDAKNVVERLRDFYRNREGGEIFSEVNLNQLIEQTIQLAKPRWKDQSLVNGITIDIINNLGQIPLVSGNEFELRETLTNLIFNSVDAITKNGSITFHTYANNDEAILEISDTGIGMPEETKIHCFEPFFSTKGERGTGLGLSVVYGIIQRHNGNIDVESEFGKGTKFIIRLPASVKCLENHAMQESANCTKSLHVLIIDDEDMIRNMLGEYLAFIGHTFSSACNGSEGLEILRSRKFDIVITDRAMPGMNGDQLAFTIKQIMPKIPVIMLTGFGNIMNASGEMPNNIDYLMNKPIALFEFRKALEMFAK